MSHNDEADAMLMQLAQAARERDEEEARLGTAWDAATDEALEELGEEAFGADFQAGVVARLRDSTQRPPAEVTAIEPGEAPRSRSGWRQWGMALAASLLLATVVGGMVFYRPGPDEAGGGPLPRYTLTALGTQAERSAEAPATGTGDRPVDAVPGFRFEVRLRPEWKPEGPVGARIVAADASGRAIPWPEAEAKVRFSEGGVVILENLSTEDWQALTPGSWTVFFALGRPESLPSRDELVGIVSGGSPLPDTPGWQLLSQEIRLGEQPP